MARLRVDIRLRPIRFAFLVRPDHGQRILDIFRINTTLWGGQFNPIIPFFDRVPVWWQREGRAFESAREVLNGYLDFYEPDFLVEAEPGVAARCGFDDRRVLQLDQLLDPANERGGQQFGLSVFDLYKELYKAEFQFVRRHDHNIVIPAPEHSSLANFNACVFGDFPNGEQYQYLETAYRDAFAPTPVRLNSHSLAELYSTGYASPIVFTREKLTVHYQYQPGPILFILDATKPRDLIDFWNLRTVAQSVVAVPIQGIGVLSEFCREYILHNYRPLLGNPNGVMVQPISMFSRSIPAADIPEIHRGHLRVDRDGANVVQTWYPPLWRTRSGGTVMARRPILAAQESRLDLPLSKEKTEIHFDPLYPAFSDEYPSGSRWANVVGLRDWSEETQLATVFPVNYRNPSFPQYRMMGDELLPTTEGLVFFPKYRSLSETWDLLDGTTAISAWFKSNQVDARPSDAGRATQQIIDTLGSPWAVRALAHEGVVKLLNDIAKKSLTKTAHEREFKNKIRNATLRTRGRGYYFEILVERKAVELGLELKCSKCGSWTWYSVAHLDYSVTCDLCRRSFEFPVSDPRSGHHARWAYRVMGPFALPDYARGGYAASLAIRFFTDVLGRRFGTEVTWASGQELSLASGKKCETDFMLWHQHREIWGRSSPTEMVFGEAKSFGRDVFKQYDVDQMKLLAQTFPGSILVFATMKRAEELSPDEIVRLRRLAEWGRGTDRQLRKSRAPVIILTATELFCAYDLALTWKDKGGTHATLIEPAGVAGRLDNLGVLADITQQLYLNLEPYGVWRHRR